MISYFLYNLQNINHSNFIIDFDKYTLAQLNEIPDGFSNNLI